jgi:CBS domain-containing protein
MQVRDGMNRITVTVGPGHTLREAARRMTERSVGAAVVSDPEAAGPGIITERDILHSIGAGEDIDAELVSDHLTSNLIYAEADWPLERAAGQMVEHRIRHVVVIKDGEPEGILSMRDIVRCWTGDGASCDVPDGAPAQA